MYIGPPTVKNESPANIPNVILGTAITAFGWYGFNGGSALSSDGEAAIVFINTSVAGAAGMITWILTEFLTRSPAKSAGYYFFVLNVLGSFFSVSCPQVVAMDFSLDWP